MIKKLLLITGIIAAMAAAAPVSFETASKVAENAVKSKKISLQHKLFTKKGKLRAEGDALFYVFQKEEDKGFVIVSGDDVFTPVIGISGKGTYDPNNLPPNFAWYLENIQREMEFAIDNKQIQTEETKDKWELYAMGDPYISGTYLIKTEWDQEDPYNNKTPIYNGLKTYTGCVATAMAQIMKYHEYPQSTTIEIPAYTSENKNIPVPAFPLTDFDWDNMTNTYTYYSSPAENNAVATLMIAAGTAVEMNYDVIGSNGSGAPSSTVPSALKNYFGYDYSIKYIEKDYPGGMFYLNGTAESWSGNWEDILKDQIDRGMPIYYSGSGSGGHAFILDGYNDFGQFHFNWGWSGYYNDWYVLSVLNPGTGNYSYDQGAVINIMPIDNNIPINNLIQKASTGGTYQMEADIEMNAQLDVKAVNEDFILDLNGHTLTIEVLSCVENGIKIAQNKTFVITDSRSGGVLNVTNNEEQYVNPFIGGAAINTTDGTLIIENGTVNAVAGRACAAIGGAYGSGGGTVIINGGTVNVTGSNGAAGIGGGSGGLVGSDNYVGGAGGDITINGGTITVTGAYNGIGNGRNGNNTGTFTMSKNAVVFTNTVSDNDVSRRTGGILFIGNNGNFYGTSITPTADFTIPSGSSLIIPEGATMTISENITFTNNGTVMNRGTIKKCGNIVGTIIGNQPDDCEETPIVKHQKSDSRYGIRILKNPVADKAEISVIIPGKEDFASTNIVIYDMTGNLVYACRSKTNHVLTWNLKNNAGRNVSNGTYLVIAECAETNGQVFTYSAKLGVKR